MALLAVKGLGKNFSFISDIAFELNLQGMGTGQSYVSRRCDIVDKIAHKKARLSRDGRAMFCMLLAPLSISHLKAQKLHEGCAFSQAICGEANCSD